MPTPTEPPAGVPVSTTAASSLPIATTSGGEFADAFSALDDAAAAVKADSKPTAPATPESPPAPQPTESAAEPDPVQAAIAKHVTAKRSYEGLAEDEVELFKNMSNAAYDKLYPLYLQSKKHGFDPKKFDEVNSQLEEARRFRYHEHPRAFELSDEYSQAQEIVNNINIVSQFWERQLIALRQKQPVSLLQRDAKGALVPTQAAELTPQNEAQYEAEILRNLNKTQTDSLAAQQEFENMAVQYKEQFGLYNNLFKKVHDDIFGKHEKILKPLAEKQLEKFPPFVRNKPEVISLAYALAALVAGASDKQAANIQKAADKATREAATSAGPSASSITSGPGKQVNGFDEAEFNEFKSKYHIV